MFNLIKMDLYRMMRTVSFRVMLLVTIAIGVFMVFATSYDVSLAKEAIEQGRVQEEMAAETEEDAVDGSTEDTEVVIELGVHMSSNFDWVYEIPMSELINECMVSGILLLLSAIFVPLFVHAEYKNGYIKNIAGQFPNRGALVGSKLVAVTVQILILTLDYMITVFISGMIFFRDTWVLGSIGEMFGCVALHLLLCLAFGYMCLMLSLVSKSAALPLTAGVLCSTGFMVLLYGGINMLIGLIRDNDSFDISLYSLEMNTSLISADMAGEDLTRILIIGIVYSLIAALISIFVVKKRDI